MQRSGKFDSARHVPREATAAIESFLALRLPLVLPIVGGSNTGKSWLMCDLARRADTPRLLLLARDLPRHDPPDLQAFATAALHAAWPKGHDLPDAPEAAAVAAALGAADERLVVLLDGLNEALDVPGFLRDWWPEGVAWVWSSGACLVFTTRPERWNSIVRAVPDASTVLFDPELPDGETDRAQTPADRRALRLGDFSPAETVRALEVYGLDPSLDHILGSHPLMFRIAAQLGLTDGARDAGRYQLIDDFVDRHLEEALDRLQQGSAVTLRARVRDLAARLPTDGGGALELAIARETAGSDATLGALIATGLLIEVGGAQGGRAEALRFTFDQVAEAMMPTPATAENLFAPGPRDPQDFRRDAVGLLRLEADGKHAAYHTGLKRLLDLLAEESGPQFLRLLRDRGETAIYVVGALPPSRSADADAILTALARTAPSMVLVGSFNELVDWIGGAPLPPARRASLLLEIAPWSNAWPLRYKDWAYADRRPDFESAVRPPAGVNARRPGSEEEIESWNSVRLPAYLNALLRDHAEAVQPLLLDALGDDRRIDKGESNDSRGEATVSTMVSGLLFHRRHDDFAGLVRHLLAREQGGAGDILGVMAETDAPALCDVVLPALSDGARRSQAIDVLRDIGVRLDPTRQAAATRGLERLLAEGGTTANRAARALSSVSPGHLGAWDHLAHSIAVGTASGWELPAVSPERFEQAIRLARADPENGLHWMEHYAGPEPEQARMAGCVSELFHKGLAWREIGCLVETKIYGFARPANGYLRPWISVARLLAQSDPDCRHPIILSTFFNANFAARPELSELAELLTDVAESEDEVQEIAKRLLVYASERRAAWKPLFTRVRRHGAAAADYAAALALVDTNPNDSLRKELLVCWEGLPPDELSPVAINVLARLQAGAELGEIFTRHVLGEIG